MDAGSGGVYKYPYYNRRGAALRMSQDTLGGMDVYEYSYYNRRDAPLRMSRNSVWWNGDLS